MTPRTRFLVWTGVVVAAFASLLARNMTDGWTSFALLVLNLASLTAMLWLLVTTPVDAIKLKRWVSVGLIVTGVWVALFAWLLSSELTPVGAGDGAPTIVLAILTVIVASIPLVIMASVLAARHRHLWGEVLGKPSAWWATPLFWNAAVVPRSTDLGLALGEFPIAGVTEAIAIVSSFLVVFAGRFDALRPPWLVMLWTLSLLAFLARDLMAVLAPL